MLGVVTLAVFLQLANCISEPVELQPPPGKVLNEI